MQQEEYFFGVFRIIYDLNREDIYIVPAYDSKLAEVYDVLTGAYTEEITLYEKYLALCRGSKVLELACGSGRITIPLAQKGYSVTGVDISPKMIEILESKIGKRIKNRIKLIIDDIKTLDKVTEKYDLVILPATTIRLLEKDVLDFINHISKYVVKGGYFIFDFRDTSQQLENKYVSEMIAHTYEKDNVTNVVFVQEECDKSNMKSRTNWLISSYGPRLEQYLAYSYMNLTTYKDVEGAARKSNFSEFQIIKSQVANNVYNCILKK